MKWPSVRYADSRGVSPLLKSDVGLSNLVQNSKDTANYKPIHQAPYKIGWKEQEITQSQIRQMRSAGVIEPSACGSVVLVRKKDGTWCFFA